MTTLLHFSPVLKTPTQPKSRRVSVAASRTASSSNTSASTSAVDDFEELINEFTDDHLEHEDMDPDMGEDDLLQKLSEMIDSWGLLQHNLNPVTPMYLRFLVQIIYF